MKMHKMDPLLLFQIQEKITVSVDNLHRCMQCGRMIRMPNFHSIIVPSEYQDNPVFHWENGVEIPAEEYICQVSNSHVDFLLLKNHCFAELYMNFRIHSGEQTQQLESFVCQQRAVIAYLNIQTSCPSKHCIRIKIPILIYLCDIVQKQWLGHKFGMSV